MISLDSVLLIVIILEAGEDDDLMVYYVSEGAEEKDHECNSFDRKILERQ